MRPLRAVLGAPPISSLAPLCGGLLTGTWDWGALEWDRMLCFADGTTRTWAGAEINPDTGLGGA